MNADLEMRCATCWFWDNEVPTIANSVKRPRGADPLVGTCHARPPEAARSAAFMVPLFPETHADRFCGSWQPTGTASGPDGGERSPADGNVIPVDFRGAA
jgi:hypothetical protein